jgi:hypothetical protein
MKIRSIITTTLLGTALFLSACGGGGGGGAAAPDTIIKGVAQAGVFLSGSTVKVYTFDSAGALVQLATTPAVVTTDATGNYQANLGPYTGPVVVKVFGTYRDEASNSNIVLPEASALQAGVASASGTVSIPVTALTDLAVRKADVAGSIKDNIASANQAVSTLFGFDIIATTPVAPTAAALQVAGVTDNQKKYTTALETLSQYVVNSSSTPAAPTAADVQNALAQISAGISTSGQVTSPQVALNLQQSATGATSIASNPNTQDAVTAAGAVAQTALVSLGTAGNVAGSKIQAIKVETTGSLSAAIFGVKAVITLPAGVTIRTDSTGATLPGVVVASGKAAGANTFVLAGVKSGVLTVGLITTHDVGIGEFATVYCDVLTSSTPVPAAFGVTGAITSDSSATLQSVTTAWPMDVFF